MKIAISVSGQRLDDEIADIFGRCPYFIFVEIKDGKVEKSEAIENKISLQSGGAGMAAAKFVAENGAEAVIAKNVGPRATDILRQFGIDIFTGSGSATEALQNFINKN